MVRDPLTFLNVIKMAKFILKRKIYNNTSYIQQEPVQQPISGAGQELRSAAISTLAPMAITGAVNAFQSAGKKTKAGLLTAGLMAGAGYLANKGYLGKTAQGYVGNAINYGKNLIGKFNPQVSLPATTAQQNNTAKPIANFDTQTGKPTSAGYKNYKNLSPEAQARIRQENAVKKQQKAAARAAKQQSIMQKKA